ncbi:MAG: septum formation initiator family protein [Flavobacteriales bacterium]|nr:septum formation initiator family protein [Flavobacteriales bacterium]MCX7768206.1 septum formation initiator family protein [Flavobacteriales bacterium]MDW8409157.1 septum formation initiator family protein [Flavobacteriales bacterium]
MKSEWNQWLARWHRLRRSRWFRMLVNKYTVTVVAFLVWMLFFDRQDYSYYKHIRQEHDELVRDTQFYYREILAAQEQIRKFKGDKRELERYAREKYFMKKDDEVVYVFLPDTMRKQHP